MDSSDKVKEMLEHKKQFKAIAIFVLGVLGVFLVILTISEVYTISNKIKEGRYIGQEIETKNTITVSGEGVFYAVPDIGLIDLSVVTEKVNVGAAQEENTANTNKIITFVKEQGVEDKDLKTTTYNISPRYDWVKGTQILRGYVVTQTLRVKIRNLDTVGDILAGAASRGANQVGSLSFTFDDPEAPRKEARKLAIANAKEKAEDLAKDLGVDIVRVSSFSESSADGVAPRFFAESAVGMGGGGPDIQTGENETKINVTVVYEIQ